MTFAKKPHPNALKSLTNVTPFPFWLDDPNRPEPEATLTNAISTDLLIIGGGFSGLWTALLAKEINPSRDIVLIEAGETGCAASGRNGGFIVASLTHGFENGLKRWPNELATLISLGHSNLQAISETIQRYNIDCDFLPSGELTVATEPYQVESLRSAALSAAPYGEKYEWLEQDMIRRQVNSPSYLGALFNPHCAMANPARLVWGLRKACLATGVRIFEHTPAMGMNNEAKSILVKTPYGSIRANRVALGTNAFKPLLNRLSNYIVPVYDYALMTEPLSSSQREEIGWHGRQGIGDSGNQFHYYRTTQDGRILWGGYDAIYYWNNGVNPLLEINWESFERLAGHFFETFPQLDGIRFTHAWGGAIDTCSRFSPFWGKAFGGKLAYSIGFTGLGVGATRFGAQIMLDLLDGRQSERNSLKMVVTKPTPFPPEPARSAVINITRWSLDQADQHQGRRNLWLKTLDAFGLGFDS